MPTNNLSVPGIVGIAILVILVLVIIVRNIYVVQQALADAMRMLNENAPNDQVIKLKALEAFQKAADGKATKIIIPSEIQGLAGLAASAKTLLEDDKPEQNQ